MNKEDRQKTAGSRAEKFHPTLWIQGQKSSSLAEKTIVLGVTGSIGAVRVVELARELIRNGAEVHAVMTEAATHILHPDALHYATGNPAITELGGRVEHVEFCGLKGRADLLLIAPATANTVGKIAYGIDDTPVTSFATTALGSGVPVMVVPAMHESMFRHPAVAENLKKLKSWGISIVGPRLEEGIAKIAANEEIVLEVERALGSRTLENRKVIITSGSTAESLDPIRILTNRASGKTGRELALEAYRNGADVTLVHRD
ncbi:MAG: bifunctional phosphopantothenoylcysteine decarboxylase/phosphopantothenate--cysteine ligase CoaBC, partial [Methanosarcina sp.]|nr:bifunctional phosphopantothenoylcysteine decarboxylase/phosphopantothenate--cysteine ligase CoaBC [Methanosarcina sp.]